MSDAQAKVKATADAANQMKTLAALHNPDMVAGGVNVITDMGDRQVNSTIGGQWKSPIKGQPAEPTRVQQLDTAATNVPVGERSTTRMNAKLERCK